MFQIDFFPIYGIILGVNYSNEEIEQIEVLADDKRHTLQIFIFIFDLNFFFISFNGSRILL